jgi:hypothetical protein
MFFGVGQVIRLGSLLLDDPDVAEADRIAVTLQVDGPGGSRLLLAAAGGAFA